MYANVSGHMSYLCMLMVEHYHNNPVLRVFCDGLVTAHQNIQRDKRNIQSIEGKNMITLCGLESHKW